jgi:glyoxylase-like metal-dependent hydrolase (beta-lactamase superfamily II)
MQLGHWHLETISGGRFLLDAGVMYGIVPKKVWQTVTRPDDFNRIPFAIHCVLARSKTHTVLIDTGYGSKMSPLDRNAHAVEPGLPLTDGLAGLGLSVNDIHAVVFTHLHWDHSGGATSYDAARRPVSTFPNATYYVNRLEWEDAVSGAPELSGSYSPENFEPFQKSGQLVLVDGDVEIAPGLWTRVTGGHTRGHQAIIFESGGEVAIYIGDLCPAVSHVRRMWCAAYDLYPVDTRRRKPQLLGEAADHGWWVLWDHDPAIAISRVERHAKREFIIQEGRERL